MEIKLALFLPRDAASVPVTRQLLDNCLDTIGVAPGTRDDIALALSEACANVIQHAGPGEEYEIRAGAMDGRCIIEVENTSDTPLAIAPIGQPVPPTAEGGRGLSIIDAVADNLRLTGNLRKGITTVHFEKVLEYLPGAPGALLLGLEGEASPPDISERLRPGRRASG
jgi:serine/threonine-protein kinase RsbW